MPTPPATLSVLLAALEQQAASLPQRTGLLLQALDDPRFGDFCSPLAIELSAQRRLPIEEVSVGLCAALGSIEGLQIESTRGFLNFRANSAFDLLHETIAPTSGTPFFPNCGLPASIPNAHFVPGPCESLEVGGSLRLFFAALLQTRLLQQFGVAARLFFAGREVDLSLPATCIRSAMQQILACDCKRATFLAYSQDLLAPAAECKGTRRFLVPPHWLQRAMLDAAQSSTCLCEGAYPTLYAAHKEWIHTDLCRAELEQLVSWNATQLADAAVYFASPIDGSDLDLSVPKLEERSNLRWYFESTLQRLEHVLGDMPLAPAADPSLESQALPKEVLRTIFKPAHAAWSANMPRYLSGLGQLLNQINAWLNAPGLRQRASQGKLTTSELGTHWAVHCFLVRAIPIFRDLGDS